MGFSGSECWDSRVGDVAPCHELWHGERYMPPRSRATPAAAEPAHVEQSQLAESVDRLTREIQAMRDELDEARAEIAWAMRTSLAEKSGHSMSPPMQPDLGWEPRPLPEDRSLLETERRELVDAVPRDSSEGDRHSPEPRPQADSPTARRAEFEQWCREVRDPAIEHSEGRRTICTARDEARLEYEIAPLPGGGWAVNWQYGFLGNQGGASHAWTKLASRDECLSRSSQLRRRSLRCGPTMPRTKRPVARCNAD